MGYSKPLLIGVNMSSKCKVGEIVVDVYGTYTVEQLEKFALQMGITLKAAESLARERLYRVEYSKRRAQMPEVVAQRKVYNKKRNAARKEFLKALVTRVGVVGRVDAPPDEK
jgi:hypothetical protein